MSLFALRNLARFTRWQAALIHLGISAIVAAAIVAVMLLVWYPSPWFRAAGGGTLLLLLIGVDVILGPVLTFIVFDPAKKSLVYDLAVIVMLQIAALVYGVHVMATARPAFVVYFRGAFDVVTANDVVTEGMDEAKLPEFQTMPLTGPRLAAARRVEHRVTFSGELDGAGLAAAWARADAVSAPSVVTSDGDRDGVPNALLEAMAAGLPAVATDAGGLPEAVEDGRTGLAVPQADPPALAEAIERLERDRELAERLVAGAVELLRERFSLEKNAARLGELLRAAADQPGR
jgi:hypothetical protein